MLPVLPLGGPEKSRLGSRDTLLTEIMPTKRSDNQRRIAFTASHESPTYRPMNVLVTELFRQEAPPPQKVDNLLLLVVKLRSAGACEDVVRQPSHAAPRVRGRVPQHQESVGGDEGVDGDGDITVGLTHRHLDPVLGEQPALGGVAGAGSAGWGAHWERAGGARQHRRAHRGQAARAHGRGHEAGPGEGGGLGQDYLPGPDIARGHEAALPARDRGYSEGQTLGVRPMQPSTRLATQLGRPAPGTLTITINENVTAGSQESRALNFKKKKC